jgi:hypothetical protein
VNKANKGERSRLARAHYIPQTRKIHHGFIVPTTMV